MLDISLTTIPLDFVRRSIKVDGFKNVFVLSKEDIILSKLGRFSEKDIEDITELIKEADKGLILKLIDSVSKRNNLSKRVLEALNKSAQVFKERFYVQAVLQKTKLLYGTQQL
ncbi:MAG: DUF6036 family nucleotidyltransferase [Bacillota bacterium]